MDVPVWARDDPVGLGWPQEKIGYNVTETGFGLGMPDAFYGLAGCATPTDTWQNSIEFTELVGLSGFVAARLVCGLDHAPEPGQGVL